MVLFNFRDPEFYLSHSLDENPTPFQLHTHTFAELYCFLQGKGVFFIEGSRYPLSPGDILIMRPAEAHYIEVDPSAPYERIILNFDIGLFDSLEPDNRLMSPYFDRKAGKANHFPADAEASRYLQNMRSPDSSRATILANLVLLMQNLCRRFGALPVTHTQEDTPEHRILRYINQNLHQELTIQELCRRFYLSRAQFCRRFKNATGTSVGRYIAAKRLIQARELLSHGQRPWEVYTACGYRDYATFYRAYKAYFGYSPSQRPDTSPENDRVTIP